MKECGTLVMDKPVMKSRQDMQSGLSPLTKKKQHAYLSDTDPQMREFLIEGYRRMTPRQKLRQVDKLTKTVQIMALARIRKQYPHCTEREHRLRLAALWLDRETMLRVFNWDPEKEGR
jgi:hypothetical protein